MSTTELKPEDLLVQSWIPTYRSRIRVLQNDLARVRSMLFVLQHVAEFPFNLFGEHSGPFWSLVRRSLETSVIVGLWRVVFDTDGASLTLRQLKTQVISNAIDDAARRRIASELRGTRASARTRQIERKLSVLRHKHFAHLDAATATSPLIETPESQITFDELRELATAADALINAIGMGTTYMTLDIDYDETITVGNGQRIKPDIEALLDDMAARCEDLRLPENAPYEFRVYWQNRTPHERAAFNEYRKKSGLPEAAID